MNVELDLRVRLREWVVVLTVSAYAVENVHARRPSDGYCNAQTKNECFHFGII